MADQLSHSMSQVSLSPNSTEDWDRSMTDDSDAIHPNSVRFPANLHDGADDEHTTASAGGKSKRTLSELLKLHAEKGTDPNFTPEEASRVADVLGQWINSSSSPYESEDDFFTRSQSQDDSSLSNAKRPPNGAKLDSSGRPRGQSESVVKQAS
ncbi:hypothetical protein EIP91_009879 [Steccherinum ochraceum]|uniref:Uncharacterized protein n=1 Tax=Steccherinum ochraceum TaxID=92696 RepID=A0A4R0RNR1_9APHY|nr:hypothetical protein EIP91_009879 [Steccherinum ochraceum]